MLIITTTARLIRRVFHNNSSFKTFQGQQQFTAMTVSIINNTDKSNKQNSRSITDVEPFYSSFMNTSAPSPLPLSNRIAPINVKCNSNANGEASSVAERDEQLILAAQMICPQIFSSASSTTAIHVKPLSGGLSNALFVLTTAAAAAATAPSLEDDVAAPAEGCSRLTGTSSSSINSTADDTPSSTTGGATTTLAMAEANNEVDVPHSVLVRVHFDVDHDEIDKDEPDQSFSFLNRERELQILHYLNNNNSNNDVGGGGDGDDQEQLRYSNQNQISSKLAPKIYGCFQNGRIEEFYINSYSLTPSTMKCSKYWTSIARIMGQLHCQNVPLSLCNDCILKDQGGEQRGGGGEKGDNEDLTEGHDEQQVWSGKTTNNCDLEQTSILKTNITERRNSNNNNLSKKENTGEIWDRIDKWFRHVRKEILRRKNNHDVKPTKSTTTQVNEFDVLHTTMSNEWIWLRSQLESTNNDGGGVYNYSIRNNAKSKNDSNDNDIAMDSDITLLAVRFAREIVFTHMDCQSLNILTSDDWITPSSTSTNKNANENFNQVDDDNCSNNTSITDNNNDDGIIRLIDYEYAGYNPRAADIANTFCECCNMNELQPNYQEEYPNILQQNMFLKEYVIVADGNLAHGLDELELLPHASPSSSSQCWDKFLAALRMEVGKHTLLSHLGWSIWAILQSMLSPIEYDYRQYAKCRMEGYRYFKTIYFPSSSP